MNCPKCQSEIPDRAKFCPECGANISSISKQDSDVSLRDLRTMAGANAKPADLSVGEMRTMVGSEAGKGQDNGKTGALIGGRYEIIEKLGQGGFAVVYKARDRKLDRLVAIKRLLPDRLQGASGQQALERFQREAQAIAKLNHRNIVNVYDHDQDADGYYIVIEYVDGGNLMDYLKAQDGKLPVTEAVRLMKGVAKGLAYAHRKNLVHRDIKPTNILIGKEEGQVIPKIVDFGLARLGAESELSRTGYGMGTPYYMPPEQGRDAKSVNHTVDIYAFGKTLYELVTGEIPDNIDPHAVPPPPELARIILKCVRSNPEDRYFSAEELISALEGVEQQAGIRSDSVLVAGASWTVPGIGMEFVWIKELNCWVGKYEVTNGEYRKYKPGHNSGEFKGHSLNRDRQPVVEVSYNDAVALAEWLTERERQAGRLPERYRFRLPSETEWMTFAQCGDGRKYPWGNEWPPKYGNYGDYTSEQAFSDWSDVIDDYNDGSPATCPVENSGRNDWGLYGVGGNVWESTVSDSNSASFGAWRGASWINSRRELLCCAYQSDYGGSKGNIILGFRLVLA